MMPINKKPHVFIVDEDKDNIKSIMNCKDCVIKTYVDYKSLLLDINMGKINKCCVGFIYQNGSVSLSSFLKNYVKGINPNIRLLVYKNVNELKELLESEIMA